MLNRMKVFIEKEGKEKTMSFQGTGKALLDRLEINPETVLLVRDGTLITPDTELVDKDSIKVLSVISGG